MAVQKHKEKHNTFFLKKTPLSSVLTSTESVSSTNTTEQTAKDETKVDVIPVSHPTPKPAKKMYCVLEDVFHLQLIANSNETCATLKSKKRSCTWQSRERTH